MLNVFGDGYWTLTLDADELLVYPHCEEVTLRRLCEHLDDSGFDALLTLMVDMYGDEPLMKAHYSRGQSFLEACPYFDPEIGPTNPVESLYSYPSYQVFSPVRQRAFWHGKNKAKLPPCINKVPLVRWRKGMAYLVSNHFISYAKLSNLQGGLLHFKFLAGFFESSLTHVKDNSGFREKALEERSFYVDTLAKNPNLSLKDSRSVRYHNSTQLIDLGWMKTSPAYEAFVGFQVVGA